MEQYYTVKEVAQIIKVDPNTIYRWIRSGKIEAVKFGDVVRIPVTEIPTYIREDQNGRK